MANPTLFRKAALDRLRSPEQLDLLLAVDRPQHWLGLGVLAALVCCALVWSVLGSIPVRVDGRAALVQPAAVVSLQAETAGTVLEVLVAPGDRVEAGQVLARLGHPDQELALEQDRRQRQLLRWSEAIARLGSDEADWAQLSDAQRVDTLDRLIADRQLQAEQLRLEAHESVAQRAANLRRQQSSLASLVQAYSDEVERTEGLVAAGALAASEALDAHTRYEEARVRKAEVDNALLDLPERQSAARKRLEEHQADLADLQIERERLLARGDGASQAGSPLTDLLAELDARSSLRSPRAGRLVELSLSPGQVVSAGQRLGTLMGEDEGEIVAVGLFTIEDGKRIDPGMSVELSPDPVPRERFGAVPGLVAQITPYPVTREALAALLGSDALAADLADQGRLIAVRATLQPDPSTASGYAWTASDGPAFPLSTGTTGTLRVVVERRRPIGYVVPFLRSLGGL